MNQKLIIVTSSIFLGLAVFLPFFGKKNSPKKNNHQHLINNSSKEKESHRQAKKKKRNQSVLLIVLIIIVIIIILLFFYWIQKDKNKNKKNKNKKTTKTVKTKKIDLDPRLKNYLPGKFYVSYSQPLVLKIYFCPQVSPKKKEIIDQLFHLDINIQKIPQEIQYIYDDLKNKKNILEKLGNAIIEFFDVLDLQLLYAVYRHQKLKDNYLLRIFKNIEQHITNRTIGNDTEVYCLNTKYDVKYVSINDIKEGEEPLNFFKRIIDDKYVSCSKVKNKDEDIIFFGNYYKLLINIKNISNELENFFKENKDDYLDYYDNYQKAINKIKKFLHIPQKNYFLKKNLKSKAWTINKK